jgi:hypothetical protein
MGKLSLNLSPYKFKSQLMCPFGPRVGHVQLNDEAVSKLLELTDTILGDVDRLSHGERLAGQISEEPDISLQLLRDEDLYVFFTDIMSDYVKSVDLGEAPDRYQFRESRDVEVDLTSIWVVSQYENEYNPIHWHPKCSLSGVLYLKVPDFPDREIHTQMKNKKNQDGKIVFINNNPSDPDTSLENASAVLAPVVGDLYVWPSRLMHCVYPFQGPGERRSVAFNGVHRYS